MGTARRWRLGRQRRRRQQQKQQQKSTVEYSGYRCASHSEPIAEIDCTGEEVDPASFYNEFVARRRPVVLRSYAALAGLGVVSDCAGEGAWKAAVRSAAGDKQIRVEVRGQHEKHGRPFGLGSDVTVSVDDFLSSNGAYYLSTQELEEDEEGRPSIASEPCTSLLTNKGAPPLTPPLLPTLLTANLNLWMGSSTPAPFEANSSGLHHDFHDNLLTLICGRKKCRLWDPSRSAEMRPDGALARVHGNGRIVYASRPDVQADGRDTDDTARRLDETEDEDEIDRLLEAALNADQQDDAPSTGAPENFSTLSNEEKRALKSVPSVAEFELGPGDALYMPAGWWHEVSSSGETHAAWNYWFHPPDAPLNFENPYTSDFWSRDWAQRCQDDPLFKTRDALNLPNTTHSR